MRGRWSLPKRTDPSAAAVGRAALRTTIAPVSLTDILRVIWRQARFLLVLIIVGSAAATAYVLLAEKEYESTASVYVETALPETATRAALQQAVSYTNYRTITLERLATSDLVLEPVIDELALTESADELAAKVVALSALDTSIIDIRARDTDPERAAAIANEVAKVLTVEFSSPPREEGIEVGVVIADRAAASDVPVQPRPALVIGLAAAAALLAGAAYALARHALDPRIAIPADLAGLRPLPLLGVVRRSARPDEWVQLARTISERSYLDERSTLLVPAESRTAASRVSEALAAHGARVVATDAAGDRLAAIPAADRAILVVRRGDRRSAVVTGLEELDASGVPVAGYVFTDVPRHGMDAHGRTWTP